MRVDGFAMVQRRTVGSGKGFPGASDRLRKYQSAAVIKIGSRTLWKRINRWGSEQ